MAHLVCKSKLLGLGNFKENIISTLHRHFVMGMQARDEKSLPGCPYIHRLSIQHPPMYLKAWHGYYIFTVQKGPYFRDQVPNLGPYFLSSQPQVRICFAVLCIFLKYNPPIQIFRHQCWDDPTQYSLSFPPTRVSITSTIAAASLRAIVSSN